MEALLMILGLAIGTAVGVGIAWLMTQRKGQGAKPTAGAAMLKEQLQNTESALANAVVASETLKKQVAQRDLMVQKLEEELKSRMGQSEQVGQERAVAAQRVAELEQHLQKVIEERTHLESVLIEQSGAASTQATEQLAQTTEQLAQAKEQLTQATQQLTAVQAELESERKLVQELAAESSRVKAEYTELQTSTDGERNQRSLLENEVEQEREQIRLLTERLTTLEAERARLDAERAQLDALLQEEKQATAQGREALAMAQEKLEKLAMVFKAVSGEVAGAVAGVVGGPVAAETPAPNGNANGNGKGNGASTNGHTAEVVTVALQIPTPAEEETVETHATVA